MKVVTEVALI